MSTHSAGNGTPDTSPSIHPDEPEVQPVEPEAQPVEPVVAEMSDGDTPEPQADDLEATAAIVETPAEETQTTEAEPPSEPDTELEAAAAESPEEPGAEVDSAEEPKAEVEATPKKEAKAKARSKKAKDGTKAKEEARTISPSEQRFRDAKNQHETLEGRVIGWNKGGLHVVINDLTAFCPRSEIEVGDPNDSGSYVDQVLEFKVLKIQDKGRRVVVSRAAALRSARSRNVRKLKKKLEVGTVLPGNVNSLTDFGAFIDLGGIQGLLHVSEISFDQVRSPADVLEIGQEVEVKIIKLESGGKRISLSMKALKPDPWLGVADRFTEGELVDGTVERTTRFGVFIQLEPGLTGLLPMSEMNLPRDASPARVFPPGRKMKVQVVSVDRRRRRISLAAEGSNLEGSRADYRSYQTTQKDSGFHPFAAALKNLR